MRMQDGVSLRKQIMRAGGVRAVQEGARWAGLVPVGVPATTPPEGFRRPRPWLGKAQVSFPRAQSRPALGAPSAQQPIQRLTLCRGSARGVPQLALGLGLRPVGRERNAVRSSLAGGSAKVPMSGSPAVFLSPLPRGLCHVSLGPL